MLATNPDLKAGLKSHVVDTQNQIERLDKIFAKLVDAVEKAKGRAVVVAAKVGGTKLSDGPTKKADGQLQGSPSQIFDAVALALSDEGAKMLLNEGAAVSFVMYAFDHLKAIGATRSAQPLLDKAGVKPDAGVTSLGADFIEAAARRFYDREPNVRLLA